MVIEEVEAREAEVNGLFCWAYWLNSDDEDEDIQYMLMGANARSDALHERCFNCQIHLEDADACDEDEIGERSTLRRRDSDVWSVGTEPLHSGDEY
eukprot:symbB.v1.2.036759.t1/scaffold5258.1/size29288/1